MSKSKIAFKEIAARITGISLPVFGVSWTPPESERGIVRETLIFLEDRRALYNGGTGVRRTAAFQAVHLSVAKAGIARDSTRRG